MHVLHKLGNANIKANYHAVWFKCSMRLTCPFRPQLDSALHLLSGCQHIQLRTVERHNLACSMIIKAISKAGSLRSCILSMDIGSNERLTMQNLQIPDSAETRTITNWLFPPRFFLDIRLPPAVWMLFWLLPPQKLKSKELIRRGWVLCSGRGQMGETGSTSAVPPATSRSPFPRLTPNL